MLRNGNKLPEWKMSKAQEQKIKTALERSFRHMREGMGPASEDMRTHDFVFHMTDWYNDLVKLARLMQRPEGKSAEEWRDAVAGFLFHVSGHLLAATKIANIEPIEFEMPVAKKKTRKSLAAAR
jgi:hypothetical protein